jgi:hypothetical protein
MALLKAYFIKTDLPYGYDMYDSCVVVAYDKAGAIKIASDKCSHDWEENDPKWDDTNVTCIELTQAEMLKISNGSGEGRYRNERDKGIVTASFNAG